MQEIWKGNAHRNKPWESFRLYHELLDAITVSGICASHLLCKRALYSDVPRYTFVLDICHVVGSVEKVNFLSIDVLSTAFEGQSVVNRQMIVYKAIWEELQNVVHAVDQMKTRTPQEAASGSEK